jgi:hypothetical protein
MSQIIDSPRSNLDKTVKIFDQFYNFDLVVGADQYEIIYSYFFDITNSANTAKNFTSILFRISSITGEDVIKLLNYLTGSSKLEVNGILIYYLNSLKSKTTLYGINVEPIPNQPVQRNVVV